MNEELAGHQISQMGVLEELIVSAAGIERLIMMSGVEEIVNLPRQSILGGSRKLVVGRSGEARINNICGHNFSAQVVTE